MDADYFRQGTRAIEKSDKAWQEAWAVIRLFCCPVAGFIPARTSGRGSEEPPE